VNVTQYDQSSNLAPDLCEGPKPFWKDAPDAMREKYIGMITQFYENNPAMQRDEAFRSAGIAAYGMMMAAAAHGYDTCTAEFRR